MAENTSKAISVLFYGLVCNLAGGVAAPQLFLGGEIIEEITISYSRVSSYLSCPQAHNYSYVERIKPKGVVRPLTFGGDFHKLLEHRGSEKLPDVYNEIKDTYRELDGRQQSQLGDEYLEELFEVFEDYTQYWYGAERPVKTEHEFKIHIANYKGIPVYFVGKIDELYKDGSIGEHKTFNQRPDLSILTMNQQSMLYAKAAQLEFGKLPPKIRWDYIKSRPAERPMWLEKSGRFSAAKSSKITHLSWLRACDEREIEDEEIRAKAEEYRENIHNFFFRYEVDIIPEMVEVVWNDFLSVVKQILTKSETNKVKNVTRDCSWCKFRPLCYAQFTGADVEYIKKTDYQSRD